MSTNRDAPGPSDDLLVSADRSLLAEVGFRGADGRWSAAVLVPLVRDGTLTFALPYAERRLATAIAEAGEVLVVCSDARLALRGWSAAAGRAAVALREDRDGERFADELLDVELRKHPPARLLADSPLLRREHWWYLPRLLLDLRLHGSWVVAARTSAREGVLFTAGSEGVHADTVAVEDRGTGLQLLSLAGASLPDARAACLLRHDAARPDLEQRAQLLERGRLTGGRLAVEERDGALDLPPPAGVLARYRAARSFARACLRELHRA